MHQLYVIGGRSRTGKSKISQKVENSRGSIRILNSDKFRGTENDAVAWQRLVNDLMTSGVTSDVLIEGVAITPKRVQQLCLPSNLTLHKVVFLGFSKASHADSILTHARKEGTTDWVYRELKKNPSYENDVRSWMEPGIRESAQLKIDAQRYGYGYFDITDYEFEIYANKVIEYLFS
jgi:hypothetical protein